MSYAVVMLTLLVAIVVTAQCSLLAGGDPYLRPPDACDWIFLALCLALPLPQIPFVVIAWRTKSRSRAVSTALHGSSTRSDSPTIVLFFGATVLLVFIGLVLFLLLGNLPP
jgi:uncharacterized membrane protein